ncbi:MAG: helix-turn-helix domain-containing protein [Candidatus Spyradocola sp.]
MGTKEASRLWGVSMDTVAKWCRQGRIPGVEQDAPRSPWRIPRTAQPPRLKKKP